MIQPFRLLVVLLLILASCGASQREQTIKAALATVNQTRDAFVDFDRAAQSNIVEVAPDYERGAAMLALYRKKREPVVEAFAATYRAIAIAATGNSALAPMLVVAKQLAAEFTKLKESAQ